MLPQDLLELVQSIKADIDVFQAEFSAWLKQHKVKVKHLDNHYAHLINPIREALDVLLNQNADRQTTLKAIQSLINHIGGFYQLLTAAESFFDSRIPDHLFSLKDSLFKKGVTLSQWTETSDDTLN